jgi:glyoxylase-like metal-dependent hydrolase (beta-lactamase superfamily II)
MQASDAFDRELAHRIESGIVLPMGWHVFAGFVRHHSDGFLYVSKGLTFQMRLYRSFAIATMGAALLTSSVMAQSHLQLKVHTGHGVSGYDVNSTMISGDKDMIVIDPQFSLSEAHKLAAEILESKKNLTLIYTTHPHPDHLFGLAVLKPAFPNARAVALPATATAAKTAWPARQKFWLPTYGNNIPGPEPVVPEELTTPELTLEGEQFPITGGVQGADGPGNSFTWIPSLKAVVTGDIVFDHVYFGVPRDKAREAWSKTIDQITALQPAIVVPGHEGPGATRDMRSIQWMKKYIADWDANVAASKNAAEMKQKVLAEYPGLGMEFTLNDRIATYFPAPK